MAEKDFTEIGEDYDKLYRTKMSDLEAITLDVLEAWRPDKQVRVCDVGAGTGLVAELLEKAAWDFDYFGIEPSDLHQQLQDKVGSERALRDTSDALKSVSGYFDAVIYSKSLHEILISKLLSHYGLDSNEDLHRLFLENPRDYQLNKQSALTDTLSDSIHALRSDGLVIVADMEYPSYLSQDVVDQSVEYVNQTFRHLNYREQTLPIGEIEIEIENTPWRIVDSRETAKRKDPKIKSKVYGLAIQKVM
jgi:SAM-dependent methyltransferase